MNDTEHNKFPIGRYREPENICDIKLDEYIKVIKDFPSRSISQLSLKTGDVLVILDKFPTGN